VLTKKSKYGLKALLVLAQETGRGPVLVSELADRQRIPKKFLEAILLELKRHGLLHSKRGRGGGYFLNRKPDDITVGQVIRVLDGPLALIPCVSQTAYARCDECVDEEMCAIRLAMKEVRDATARILDNTTLAGLNARVHPARDRRTSGKAGPPAPLDSRSGRSEQRRRTAGPALRTQAGWRGADPAKSRVPGRGPGKITKSGPKKS
jgi:Rrf2 family protein